MGQFFIDLENVEELLRGLGEQNSVDGISVPTPINSLMPYHFSFHGMNFTINLTVSPQTNRSFPLPSKFTKATILLSLLFLVFGIDRSPLGCSHQALELADHFSLFPVQKKVYLLTFNLDSFRVF